MHCLTSRNESPCKAQQTWTISIFKHFLPYCVFFQRSVLHFFLIISTKNDIFQRKKTSLLLTKLQNEEICFTSCRQWQDLRPFDLKTTKHSILYLCNYFLFFGGGVKNKMTHSVCLSWLVWPTLYKMSLWLNRLFPAQNTTFNSPTML